MTKISSPKITIDWRNSYLKMISNSVGTKLFRNFYIYLGKKRKDAVEGGKLSCAFFVSSILRNFGLIKEPHLTVKSALKDMKQSGWFEIKKPRQGAILVWEKRKDERGIHKHIGFYICNHRAISNSFYQRKPIRHHWTFGKKGSKSYRRIVMIFWHKKLTR